MEQKGVIYILTNPSFPQYVKIGYADNVESRLKQLNNSECIPFAFRIYATYEVEERLTDLSSLSGYCPTEYFSTNFSFIYRALGSFAKSL